MYSWVIILIKSFEMEWNEVKAKPKRKAKKTQEEDEGFQGTFAAQ